MNAQHNLKTIALATISLVMIGAVTAGGIFGYRYLKNGMTTALQTAAEPSADWLGREARDGQSYAASVAYWGKQLGEPRLTWRRTLRAADDPTQSPIGAEDEPGSFVEPTSMIDQVAMGNIDLEGSLVISDGILVASAANPLVDGLAPFQLSNRVQGNGRAIKPRPRRPSKTPRPKELSPIGSGGGGFASDKPSSDQSITEGDDPQSPDDNNAGETGDEFQQSADGSLSVGSIEFGVGDNLLGTNGSWTLGDTTGGEGQQNTGGGDTAGDECAPLNLAGGLFADCLPDGTETVDDGGYTDDDQNDGEDVAVAKAEIPIAGTWLLLVFGSLLIIIRRRRWTATA